MLQPTRTKYRKAHKGRIHGRATRGEKMNYGHYGLKSHRTRKSYFKTNRSCKSCINKIYEKNWKKFG